VILGVLLPAGLFALGALLTQEKFPALSKLLASTREALPDISMWVFGYFLLLSLITFSASLSNNTLQGILLGFGLIILLSATVTWVGMPLARGIVTPTFSFWYYWLPNSYLRNGAGVPEMFPVEAVVLIWILQRLAFANYRHPCLSLRGRVMQVGFVSAVAALITVPLYAPVVFREIINHVFR
jgi:hypothetical protein